jgi:hypothetical protein
MILVLFIGFDKTHTRKPPRLSGSSKGIETERGEFTHVQHTC